MAASGASSGAGGSVGVFGGLMSNPITMIAGAALGIGQLIFSIREHHAQAVKNEAATMNSVVPAVAATYQDIVAGLNAGKITKEQALSYADAAVKDYESFVYDQRGVKRKAGNGPDQIENSWIKKWDEGVKGIINAGGGTFFADSAASLSGRPQPGKTWNGFTGVDPWSVTYTPKTAAATTASTSEPAMPGATGNTTPMAPSSGANWLLIGGIVFAVLLFSGK